MHKKNIQVSTDHYSKDKYCSLGRFISYYYQIDVIKRWAKDKILFIGTGDGVTPFYLRDRLGRNIVTYDFEEELKPDVVGDVRDLPFEDNSFSTIVAFEVLEHIPFEDFSRVLERMSKIATHSIIFSVPSRSTSFESVWKFPGIRTLLHMDFLRLHLPILLTFPGFESSGQHYWEIDRKKYSIRKIRREINKFFIIKEEFTPMIHSHQQFFVLQKKLSNK